MSTSELRPAKRTVSSSIQEIQCWKQTSKSLGELDSISQRGKILVSNVNTLISALPDGHSDSREIPEKELESVKLLQGNLIEGVSNIYKSSMEEANAIDDALKHLSVLIALRKNQVTGTAESGAPAKGIKRCRSISTSGRPLTMAPESQSRERELLSSGKSVSSSSNNPSTPASSTPVNRPSGYQVSKAKPTKNANPEKIPTPLQTGRRVIFHPTDSEDTNRGMWIVAIVTRFLGYNKLGGKYEIQDAEPENDGQPGMKYTANRKSFIPLPDRAAAPGSSGYLKLHSTFPVGSSVLALYPDTTCFYRATVIAAPSTHPASANATCIPCCQLKFEGEDDDALIFLVSVYDVVRVPP